MICLIAVTLNVIYSLFSINIRYLDGYFDTKANTLMDTWDQVVKQNSYGQLHIRKRYDDFSKMAIKKDLLAKAQVTIQQSPIQC